MFHLWTGLSVLSSAVRRNVVLNQGIYLLFPNMYVVLVGPPGKVAKSTSIRMGRRILLGVENIFFGPDSVTTQELIRQLSGISIKQKMAAMTIHSTEMSSLIDPSGVTMIQFLTDIYDGDFVWRYATKGSGKDTIDNPVLNILAATTPSWIAEGLPIEVIDHGFVARCIFIYADTPRYLKPFPNEPDKGLVRQLTNDLDHISRLEGEFRWGEGSKERYTELYTELASTIPTDYRLGGFHFRKKIHILKIAMLLSVAESDDLIIEVRDLNAAWGLLEMVEKDMGKAFSSVGSHRGASDIERILDRIYHTGGMTSQQIHDKFFAMGDVKTIAQHLTMLISAGKITRGKNDKGETIYLPTKEKKNLSG